MLVRAATPASAPKEQPKPGTDQSGHIRQEQQCNCQWQSRQAALPESDGYHGFKIQHDQIQAANTPVEGPKVRFPILRSTIAVSAGKKRSSRPQSTAICNLTYARFSELSSNHRTDLNVGRHHGGYPQ